MQVVVPNIGEILSAVLVLAKSILNLIDVNGIFLMIIHGKREND